MPIIELFERRIKLSSSTKAKLREALMCLDKNEYKELYKEINNLIGVKNKFTNTALPREIRR